MKKRDGTVVRVLALGKKATGVRQTAHFTCGLPAGTYQYWVFAKDLAGNPQIAPAHNRFVVR